MYIKEYQHYHHYMQKGSYLVTLIYSALGFTVEELEMPPVDPLKKGWDKWTINSEQIYISLLFFPEFNECLNGLSYF